VAGLVKVAKGGEASSSSTKPPASGGNPNEMKCDICEDVDAGSFCLQCSQYFCEGCQRGHKRAKASASHQFTTVANALQGRLKTLVLHCGKHPEQELTSYCRVEEVTACLKCVVESHMGHRVDTLANSAKEVRGTLRAAAARVQGHAGKLQVSLRAIDDTLGEVGTQAEATETEIHSQFEQLRELVNEREAQLLGDVDDTRHQKEKDLRAQKDQLEFLLAGVRESSTFAGILAGEGTDAEVLAAHRQVLARLTGLEAEKEKCRLEPVRDATLELVGAGQAEEALRTLVRIGSQDISLDASVVEVQSLATSVIVGQQFSLRVTVVDRRGKKLAGGVGALPPFVVTITSENLQYQRLPLAKVSELAKRDGEYEISFTPTLAGVHIISVCHKAKHLRGSPFHIDATLKPRHHRNYSQVGTLPLLTFGSKGIADGAFGALRGVTCNSNGDILVTDSADRIQVFDKRFKFLFKIGTKGSGPGQFMNPHGLTVDQRNGNIVVADSGNHRIQIFDEKGVFLNSFGSQGTREGELGAPCAVVVDQRGNYYVTEHTNHRVQVFDASLRSVLRFGVFGDLQGQLNSPIGIGMLSNGHIVVTERGNSRLQVFDFEGGFVRSVGESQLSQPYHLFVDSNDHILVADSQHKRVAVFRSDGGLVRAIGNPHLMGPVGVCMDQGGRIIVAEYGAHRLAVF